MNGAALVDPALNINDTNAKTLAAIASSVLGMQRSMVHQSDANLAATAKQARRYEDVCIGLIEVLDLVELLQVDGGHEDLKRIARKITQTLRSKKIERIQVQKVTPGLVKVIDTRSMPDVEDGEILEVLRPGYQIAEKVLRPMDVISNRKDLRET